MAAEDEAIEKFESATKGGKDSKGAEKCQPCAAGHKRVDCGGGHHGGDCVLCDGGTYKVSVGEWDTACTACDPCPAAQHRVGCVGARPGG